MYNIDILLNVYVLHGTTNITKFFEPAIFGPTYLNKELKRSLWLTLLWIKLENISRRYDFFPLIGCVFSKMGTSVANFSKYNLADLAKVLIFFKSNFCKYFQFHNI